MMHLRPICRLFYATALFATAAAAGTNGLDASFGSGGVVLIGATPDSALRMRRINALQIEGDGKIIVGGSVWGESDPAEKPAIGRLNADGSWDTLFGDHGLFVLAYGADAAPYGGRIDHVSLFSDGRVLASGATFQVGGYYYSCALLVALTTVGAPDAGFAPDHSGAYCFDFAPPPTNTYWFGHWADVKVDSDDSFYLTSADTNLDQLVSGVARFDSMGSLIDTYGSNGIAPLPQSVATGLLEILPDHRTLAIGLSGSAGNLGVGAAQLDLEGNAEMSYGDNGVSTADIQPGAGVYVSHASLDSGFRMLISSASLVPGYDWSAYRLARLTSAGTVDATFNDNGQQAGAPGVAVISLSSNPEYDGILGAQALPDGHILVVGQNAKVTDDDGTFNISLLRLKDDAAWDVSFGDVEHPGWASLNIGGKSESDGRPYALAVDPRDGRIVVGIVTSDANDGGCVGLLRIVADRLLDASFDEAPAMPTCPQ
jgi:uncharacterized delta-60 repeat protein